VGPWVLKEALDTFTHLCNGKDVPELELPVTPQLLYAIFLRAVRGAILQNVSKINRVDLFLNRHNVKIPIKIHVKFQNLIPGAESRLHMPYSQLISYPYIRGSRALLEEKYEQCLSGSFIPEVPS